MLTLISGVRSTPACSRSGRSQLNTHTPLTQRSQSGLTLLSRHIVLDAVRETSTHTHNSPGNVRSQSSPLAEPLWTDPGQKEWNWCAPAYLHVAKRLGVGGGVHATQFEKKPAPRSGSSYTFELSWK